MRNQLWQVLKNLQDGIGHVGQHADPNARLYLNRAEEQLRGLLVESRQTESAITQLLEGPKNA